LVSLRLLQTKVAACILRQYYKQKVSLFVQSAGLYAGVKLDTPGIDLKGIYDGYQFLESVYVNGVDNYLKNNNNNNSSNKYKLGKEVIVIGGGDTALDCARTALRLVKGNVTIVYRRTENECQLTL
jgi:NADPH-dependent glutamate synthase beta subunit-like oxidoreductase